jgi:hypothetical protein
MSSSLIGPAGGRYVCAPQPDYGSCDALVSALVLNSHKL